MGNMEAEERKEEGTPSGETLEAAFGKLDQMLEKYKRLFEARTKSLSGTWLYKAFPHLRKGRYAERFK